MVYVAPPVFKEPTNPPAPTIERSRLPQTTDVLRIAMKPPSSKETTQSKVAVKLTTIHC